LLLPTDQETWADAFAIEAGPWAVHLTGTALPAPQLAINLRANLGAIIPMEPFLTLVRPAQGFETVNLDSDGSGKIALPRGDSVMLVQGDEVWEVHLSFRNG
jgi:glycine/D-amino acid oxidase-like deaminating enzyme